MKNINFDFKTYNAQDALAEIYLTDINKVRNIIESVERQIFKTSLKQNLKKCNNCKNNHSLILKFKKLEDLVVYLKYIYENKIEFYFSSFFFFEKNLFDFIYMENLVNKVIKQNLNSTKFLCNSCLVDFLNKPNGIFDLFNKFEIQFENIFEEKKTEALDTNEEKININNFKNEKNIKKKEKKSGQENKNLEYVELK